MLEAERITGVITHHGEGPFWDAQHDRLLFVDLLAGAVVELSIGGEVTRRQVSSRVASVIRRRRSGGFVIAVERGVVVANETLSEFEPLADFDLGPNERTNEGGCDPLGNFLVGSMAYDGDPGGGSVYRLTPEGRTDRVLAGVSISNGLQWTRDGTQVFYTDSPTRRIDVFDVDPVMGNWSERRPHIQLGHVDGVPDGMAIDDNDGLWVALWGGGAVHHFDSQGCLVESIRVPGVSQVSSCTFGGKDRSVLYITTSRQGLPDGSEPDAGAVFAFQTNARGAALAEFSG